MNRQFRALALSLFVRQRLTFFVAKERSSDLERLTEFIETGKVTPSIDRVYPLAEAPDAMRYLTAGKARGKIAISI
jgi:NADPH:quinone reductase-like Zn-dependent oxidoreductase